MKSKRPKPEDADNGITLERIDELLAFLSRLPGLARDPIREYGIKKTGEKSWTIHPPLYVPEVEAFFRAAAQPWWCDHNYIPEEAGRWVGDDAFIAQASLDQIKTMLTYCVRGERFCDGLWAGVLSGGRIAAILNRLRILREDMAREP